MIFLIFVVGLGVLTAQKKRYWLYALGASFLQNLTMFLLSGGGTLEDPQGDGFITAIVRASTNDGPILAVLGVLALVLGWVVPIYLIKQGYQRKQVPQDL